MAKDNNQNAKSISVVMPTFTGADNIARSLASIAKQKVPGYSVELVVVVDGPNRGLFESIKNFEPKFKETGKELIVKMLPKNQGRYKAILTGAQMATGKWMVFMGDRILLPDGYLATMAGLKKDAAIADTIEDGWERSAISLTLHHVRDRLYKKRGGKLKPFFISKDNFEKSGKGNGGMWLDRQLFLQACAQIKDADKKHTSDDTKLLNILVNNDHPIYWTNQTHIIYCPRPGFLQQLNHIYQRGPRFVNYYIKPGTRYFMPLVSLAVISMAIIFVAVIKPLLLLWLLVVTLVVTMVGSFYLMQKLSDVLKLAWAVPLILITFYAGVLRGLVIHFANGKK